jgi:alpha-galactosidase
MRQRMVSGALALAALAAAPAPRGIRPVAARIDHAGIRVEFDQALHSRVVSTQEGHANALGPFSASEVLTVSGTEVRDFPLVGQTEEEVQDVLGHGRRLALSGRGAGLLKSLSVTVYDDFPGLAVFQVRYTNERSVPVTVSSWTNNRLVVTAGTPPGRPAFWSYQAGSYESRPDWVLPLKPGFTQDNFQGMNATDYGGGTPVVDVWRRDVGLAVGHLELTPKQVSLPVAMPGASQATVGVRGRGEVPLAPGATFDTLRTFVAVHRGDHYQPLSTYRRLMVRQGVVLPAAPASAFEPIWCAWGYGREFTADQVVGTLPVAKRLGFAWATLDDGWQVAEGDWVPVAAKFPSGDADMKALVDRIHAQGMKAMLWWAPLAADPGTRLLREHPDQLLLDAAGGTRKITWWDSLYLCPAYGRVRDDARAFVRKAMVEWGFDGLKIDGQHLNGAPPCHNPAHAHARPEEGAEGLPGFFQAVYQAALTARPEAVVEICPCGTAYSFFNLPFLNMAVASDPTSSWQIRLKGKTLKALMGDGAAYFGDHVELSTGGEDFASTVGVGGVIGTNFAWPGAPGKKDPQLLLTPAREKAWALWTRVYQEKRLSQGRYLGGLYDIGFDRPEAHAVEKDGRLYYAFYAPRFSGEVQLRGLEDAPYAVRDYVAGRDLGRVRGPAARLPADFRGYLLLEAVPDGRDASSRSALVR